MKKTITLISLFAIVMAGEARNLTLDLSGNSKNAKSLACCRSVFSGNEEIRSHRLQAGAAKVSGLETGDVITFKLFADNSWTEVSAGSESSFRFFMVTVEMR